MARSHGNHRMPGYDPLGRGMLATWWNLCSTSRNMPLKPPKKKKLARWPKEIKEKTGYYIAKSYEGINPATGFKYRRYTLIRLNRRI